jgi:hypothetical protein
LSFSFPFSLRSAYRLMATQAKQETSLARYAPRPGIASTPAAEHRPWFCFRYTEKTQLSVTHDFGCAEESATLTRFAVLVTA